MMEFGDARWTVLVQHVTPLLLQRPTRETSIPHGIWPIPSSDMGYPGHGTALYVPAWDIPNKPSQRTRLQSSW